MTGVTPKMPELSLCLLKPAIEHISSMRHTWIDAHQPHDTEG